MNLNELTVSQLKRAVSLKERIAELESELAGILGGSSSASTSAAPRKNTMSAEGRARIAAAARARWAKFHAAKGAKPAKAAAPKKRKMSAEGKARIVAAAKARWAKFHAAKAGKSK